MEWKLHPRMFLIIDNLWGPHTMDRFAAANNTQLSHYISHFLDPLAVGMDALAQQDLAEENNYVNPPFCMLTQVLDIIQNQKAYATVIAPTGQHSHGSPSWSAC